MTAFQPKLDHFLVIVGVERTFPRHTSPVFLEAGVKVPDLTIEISQFHFRPFLCGEESLDFFLYIHHGNQMGIGRSL